MRVPGSLGWYKPLLLPVSLYLTTIFSLFFSKMPTAKTGVKKRENSKNGNLSQNIFLNVKYHIKVNNFVLFYRLRNLGSEFRSRLWLLRTDTSKISRKKSHGKT
jgi:hypothetical protein